MTIERVYPGDPMRIPAEAYNAFADAAEANERSQAGPSGGPLLQATEPDIVWVKNSSGSDRDRWEVLGIDAPLITPTENEAEFERGIVFDGDTPDAADHTSLFVILLAALPDGKVGPAAISGVVQCHLDVDDSNHKFADVTDGDATKLTSAETGAAQILWVDTSSGSDWAIVRLGVPAAPFKIEYEGVCMVEKDNATTAYAGTAVMSNSANGPATILYPASGSEERLCVKFARPFTTTVDSRLFIALDHDIDWEFTADPASGVFGWQWLIYFIDEDFDVAGGSCATWDSLGCQSFGHADYPSSKTVQPKTTALADLSIQEDVHDVAEIGGSLTFNSDLALTGNGQPHVFAINGPAAGTTVYGLMIIHSFWFETMGGAQVGPCQAETSLVSTNLCLAIP